MLRASKSAGAAIPLSQFLIEIVGYYPAVMRQFPCFESSIDQWRAIRNRTNSDMCPCFRAQVYLGVYRDTRRRQADHPDTDAHHDTGKSWLTEEHISFRASGMRVHRCMRCRAVGDKSSGPLRSVSRGGAAGGVPGGFRGGFKSAGSAVFNGFSRRLHGYKYIAF